jgi:imidazolonepropionase-like amidohydrolase
MNSFIVKGAWLIDGTGRPPVENGAVRIEGERIAAVGTEKEIGAPPAFRVIDCGDQVLIPGLIDCHGHVSMDPTQDNWPARLNDSDVEQTLRAVNNLAADLKAGVTTARSLGDRNFLDVTCKKAVESGKLLGPRLLVATRGIRATHGHGMVGYPFDGPDAVRHAVRENIKAGADIIKLFITGTVRAGLELPCFPSPEEVSVAIEESHRAGLRTAAHCIGGPGFETCLAAGLDCFEHGYFFTDRQIELLLKSGRWLDLTPSPFFTEERIRTLPAEIADAFRKDREEVGRRMEAIIRSGVKFAAGTDGMHGELARELEYIVGFGASESQALAAVTRNAAAVLGLEESVGTLEAGKFADIVAVQGNPLKDIRALKKVEMVISRGRVIFSEPLTPALSPARGERGW